MQTFKEQTIGRTVTEENFIGWTESELLNLWKANSFTQNPPKIESFLNGRRLTSADRDFIHTLATSRAMGQRTRSGSYEEAVFPRGGQVGYTKDRIYVMAEEGDVKILTNSAVPTMLESLKPFSHDLVTVLSGLCDIQKGAFSLTVPMTQFVATFGGEKSVISPNGVYTLLQAVQEVCTKSTSWKSVGMNTYQGPAFVEFLHLVLKQALWEDYFSLHTLVVLYFSKAFVFTLDKGRIQLQGKKLAEDKKNLLVNGSSYCILQKHVLKSADARYGYERCEAEIGISPIIFCGNLRTPQRFIQPRPTNDKILSLASYAEVLRSGSSRGIGGMIQALGTGGMQSSNVSRSCYLMGVILSLLKDMTLVDVQVGMAELGFLIVSLIKVVGGINECSVRFILNDLTLRPQPSLAQWVIPNRRDGSLLVLCEDDRFPSVNSKLDINKELAIRAEDTLVRWRTYGMSIIFANVYHPTLLKGKYVYQWTMSPLLYGIVSTIPLGCLIGHELIEKDISKGLPFAYQRVEVPLCRFEDFEKWTDYCMRSMAQLNVYSFCPTNLFTPLANNLRSTTRGVVLDLEDELITDIRMSAEKWQEVYIEPQNFEKFDNSMLKLYSAEKGDVKSVGGDQTDKREWGEINKNVIITTTSSTVSSITTTHVPVSSLVKVEVVEVVREQDSLVKDIESGVELEADWKQ